MIKEVSYINYFNEHKEKIKAEINDLEKALKQTGYHYKNTEFQLSPKISIVDQEFRNYAKEMFEDLITILNKLNSAYLNDENIQSFYSLDDFSQCILTETAHKKNEILVSRFDCLISEETGDINVIENNTDCPAGLIFTGRINKIIKSMNTSKSYLSNRDIVFENIDRDNFFYEQLLSIYQKKRPGDQVKHIVVLQKDASPSLEMLTFKEMYSGLDVVVNICDLKDLVEKEGFLYYQEKKIDLIWNKINTANFFEYYQSAEAKDKVISLINTETVVINNFQSRLISENKLTSAVLSDPKFHYLFSVKERGLLRRHIPWSRKLEDTTTTHSGEQIELIDFVLKYKDDLVLKAPYDIRGDGVTIGTSTSQKIWDKLVKRKMNKGYTIQKYIEPKKTYVPNGDYSATVQIPFSLDAFILNSIFCGFGSKVSSQKKMNIFQGGSKHVILTER